MFTTDYTRKQITDFLSERGHQPTSKKGANWWYRSPLRNERTASFKVDVSKNLWYDFGIGKGGTLRTLAELLHVGGDFGNLRPYHRQTDSASSDYRHQENGKSNDVFTNVASKKLSAPSLLNYLSSRGIDADVAERYCREVHYTTHGKNYFAIGFPNRSGGYEIRNAFFKGCIAPKDISVIAQGNAECHVFEGFMDFLSYVVLHGDCDAVVLNSVINAGKSVDVLNKYGTVYCHLDNDEAGRNATRQLMASCTCKVVDASAEYADCKDVNEYLCKVKVARQSVKN